MQKSIPHLYQHLQMEIMAKLLKLPYWLLSVFSWEKSFRNNPIIGNYLLNKLGLHVMRVIISHTLFHFRLWLLSPLVSKADRQSFKENGFILKHNFLPEADFIALKQELCSYNGAIRETVEGNTLTQRVFLNKAVLPQLPECQRFIHNDLLTHLMRYCSSKNRLPLFYVENLKFHSVPSCLTDPQQDFHTDTFHPCVKSWLFMDEVNEDNGPHIYIPGSQRLTWQRLRWEYQQSLIASKPATDNETGRYWDGSFRVGVKDLEFLQYGQPRVFHVPANTLLIGNVHGIHRRGDAQGQTTRMTIWMQARDNPFNPLFTPFPQLTAGIFESFWQRMMDKRDRKLEKAGKVFFKEGGFR
jgi:hypothetical protein